MDQPPVRICCGQPHFGAECPDGKVMCCLCFYRFGQGKLYRDADGITWDICKGCEKADGQRKQA